MFGLAKCKIEKCFHETFVIFLCIDSFNKKKKKKLEKFDLIALLLGFRTVWGFIKTQLLSLSFVAMCFVEPETKDG